MVWCPYKYWLKLSVFNIVQTISFQIVCLSDCLNTYLSCLGWHVLLSGSQIFSQFKFLKARIFWNSLLLSTARMFPIQCRPSPQLISMFAASHGKHLRKPHKSHIFPILLSVHLRLSTWIKTAQVNISQMSISHEKHCKHFYRKPLDESQGCPALRQSLSHTFRLTVICWRSWKHCQTNHIDLDYWVVQCS